MMLPRKTIPISIRGQRYDVSYFDRPGETGTVLFVHGLGNSTHNFEHLESERALAGYRLVAMDLPGSGETRYHDKLRLTIDDTVDVVDGLVEALCLGRFLLVGASMGGLVGLLYAERRPERVLGFMNVEGNLAPEDCLFSSLVTPHLYSHFVADVFPKIKADLRKRTGTGFRKHLGVLETADPQAYYDYSFQLVEDSANGRLIDRFLALPFPRYFVYASANRHLSYLPTLRASDCKVIEIPDADHFLFYDHPAAFAESIASAVEGRRDT